MSLVAGLRDVLKPGAVARTTDGNAVELRETTREVDMRVRVTGLPALSIAIRMKSGDHARNVRDGSWKQICDYLLVAESGERTDAVFIELKRTRTREDKPREQLRRSLPLLEYLRSVCEIESETLLQGRLRVRYWILFARTSDRQAKQRVRFDPEAAPEEYKGIEIRTFVGRRVVPLGVLTGD